MVDAIRAAGSASSTGSQFGTGEVTLFTYGPDADRLFAAMEPILRSFPPDRRRSAPVRQLRGHPRHRRTVTRRTAVPRAGEDRRDTVRAMSRYTDDLALAHVLADTADAISLSRFRALDLRVESKPDLTPVSDADTSVEKALRATLSRARPRDGVLGEEFGETGRGRAGVPAVGHRPDRRDQELRPWRARLGDADRAAGGRPAGRRAGLGAGAGPALVGRARGPARSPASSAPRRRRSGCRASPSSPTPRSPTPSCPAGRSVACSTASSIWAGTVWRTRGYGDFYSYMLLAEGAVDIAAEPEVSLWDLAALVPIVTEAGGRFTDLSGDPGPAGGKRGRHQRTSPRQRPGVPRTALTSASRRGPRAVRRTVSRLDRATGRLVCLSSASDLRLVLPRRGDRHLRVGQLSPGRRRTPDRPARQPPSGLLLRLASHKTYLVGLVFQILGFLFAFFARRDLPLFLVQTGVAAGLGVTAILGVLLLKWRHPPAEIALLIILGVGLAALIISARAQPVPTARHGGGRRPGAGGRRDRRARPAGRPTARLTRVRGARCAGRRLVRRGGRGVPPAGERRLALGFVTEPAALHPARALDRRSAAARPGDAARVGHGRRGIDGRGVGHPRRRDRPVPARRPDHARPGVAGGRSASSPRSARSSA